jgi:hypothetical protein
MSRLLGSSAQTMAASAIYMCCGCHVVPGHIVRFKTEVMDINYQVPRDPEPNARINNVIKAVLVLDGTKRCTIGFLP